MGQRSRRPRSFGQLIKVGTLAGLCVGAASGFAVLTTGYVVWAVTLGGNSTQLAPVFIPFATIFGALLGAVVGLAAGVAAALGAKLAGWLGRSAAGAGAGAGIGGFGAAVAVLAGSGTFTLLWAVVAAGAVAGVSALGLTRQWLWGTPFCRPKDLAGN